MVIFRDELDKASFLLEIGKKLHEDDDPRDHHIFIQKRAKTIEPIKQYFRQRAGKRGWLVDRLGHTFALRRWHHSPEGRKRHRQLARYNARQFLPQEGILGLRKDLARESVMYNSLIDQIVIELMIESIDRDLNQ